MSKVKCVRLYRTLNGTLNTLNLMFKDFNDNKKKKKINKISRTFAHTYSYIVLPSYPTTFPRFHSARFLSSPTTRAISPTLGHAFSPQFT